jgi:RecB family exonuclease
MSGGSGVLQAQANCPFRAFAGKRLFLEPLDDYHAGLSAAQRGSLLHDALYVLWGDIGDSDTLQGMDESAVLRSVNTAVAAAVARLPAGDRQRAGMHCLDLEQRRLATLVLEWLQVERSRDRFRVVAREQAIACRLGDLSLSLRVDRVDELADGSRVVIDYKSGRSAISAWLGERPAQPQLPLYGLSGATAAVAFAQVRARDCKILGLGEVSGIAGIQADIGKAVKRYSVQEDWAGLVAEWERNLTRLAAQFLAGDARVEPLPGACNYCGMQPLCRVELDAEADA